MKAAVPFKFNLDFTVGVWRNQWIANPQMDTDYADFLNHSPYHLNKLGSLRACLKFISLFGAGIMLFLRFTQCLGSPKTLTQRRQGAKVLLEKNLPAQFLPVVAAKQSPDALMGRSVGCRRPAPNGDMSYTQIILGI